MIKKKTLFSFSILIILIFILFIIVGKLGIGKQFVKNYFWHYLPQKSQIIIKLILDDRLINNFKNDYNIKFLPETQFEDINFTKVNLDFLKESSSSSNYLATSNLFSFFIEKKNDSSFILVSDKAEIYELQNSYILNNSENKKNYKQIQTDINVKKVLDVFIINSEIYLSFVSEGLTCDNFKIMKANLNEKKLNFTNFFNIDECGTVIQGGRMQYYNHNNQDGLLFTTGDNYADSPNGKSQKTNSIFGKVIFKAFNSSEYEIFSLGHRNPQGLFVENDLILMTEHGPKGGDEINKIIFNKNYGWPIASYGDTYNSNGSYKYKKSHSENDFEEPIYSFIPSIGISEIIKIPNEFSEKWIDNFIITSLFGRSIYRVKFDSNFNKLIYVEKIYIGQRIRDIKYMKNKNLILLALEEKGQIGILSSLNYNGQ